MSLTSRDWFRPLLILGANLCVLAVLVVVAEFASSMFIGKLGSNVVPSFRLNHTWRPNSHFVHFEWIRRNPDYPDPYVHYYNRQGWIETYDIEQHKPANTYRIFYVGDSFTEGTAPMAGSVPSLVEKGLNELTRGDVVNFEVINTGTMSYSPTIFYILVRYVLSAYDPDLIVANIDMTNDYDDWKYQATLITDAHGDPWAAPPRDIYAANYVDTPDGPIAGGVAITVQLFLLQNSYVYNLILAKFGTQEQVAQHVSDTESRYQRWAWNRKDWDEETQRNVEYTLDLLTRLARFTQQNGIKLMLTAVPHYAQYAGRSDGSGEPAFSARPHYEIEGIARENAIPYLNSFEALRPAITGTPDDKYYYRGDVHLNPLGYALWAKAQLEFLTRQEMGLLPKAFYDAR